MLLSFIFRGAGQAEKGKIKKPEKFFLIKLIYFKRKFPLEVNNRYLKADISSDAGININTKTKRKN